MSACAEIEKDQRDELAKLDAPPADPALAIPKDELSIEPAGLGRCLFAGRGAWSISVVGIEKLDPSVPGASAAVRVVYTGDDGQQLAFDPAQKTGGNTLARYAVLKSFVYDANGDGIAELYLCEDLVVHAIIGTGFMGRDDIGACGIYEVDDGAVVVDDRKDGRRIATFRDSNGSGPPVIETFPE